MSFANDKLIENQDFAPNSPASKDLAGTSRQNADSKRPPVGEGEGGTACNPVVIPPCRFVKKNGTRCDSPAMRGQRFCYFHSQPRRLPKLPPNVPDPRDTTAVLNFTLQGLMDGTLDHKRAGKILFIMQELVSRK